jgi:hypothetical protein
MSGKDYQRSKVYRWEEGAIAPRSSRTVPFDACQGFVDGVFLAHGWHYPPKVKPIRKTSRTLARGGRHELLLPKEGCPDWVILHELAHTCTITVDQDCDNHGADFMGNYLKLLDRVLGIPLCYTMFTLQGKGIKFNLGAAPYWQEQV